MNNTFASDHLTGVALAPQTIAAGNSSNGARIVAPGQEGRKLAFIITSGSLTGVTTLTIKVQYSQNNGTSWSDLLQQDGVSVMTFTASKTIAGGALDSGQSGTLMGSLDLQKSPHGDYRLVVLTVTGAAVTLSATYVVYDMIRKPSQSVVLSDDLLPKQIPALVGVTS